MLNDLFWAVYFIDVLSSFVSTLICIGLLGLIVTITVGTAHYMYRCDENDTREQAYSSAWKTVKRIMGATAVVFVICLILPEKSTMYIMLGIKMTDNVAESDFGKKLKTIVDKQMDQYINNLSPSK